MTPFHYPPEGVIKIRSEGKNFVAVNEEINKVKEKKGEIKEHPREEMEKIK